MVSHGESRRAWEKTRIQIYRREMRVSSKGQELHSARASVGKATCILIPDRRMGGWKAVKISECPSPRPKLGKRNATLHRLPYGRRWFDATWTGRRTCI